MEMPRGQYVVDGHWVSFTTIIDTQTAAKTVSMEIESKRFGKVGPHQDLHWENASAFGARPLLSMQDHTRLRPRSSDG